MLRKDEEEWWFAKHQDGRTGSIPVPYVQVVSLLMAWSIIDGQIEEWGGEGEGEDL